jgi:hypothetical protein
VTVTVVVVTVVEILALTQVSIPEYVNITSALLTTVIGAEAVPSGLGIAAQVPV